MQNLNEAVKAVIVKLENHSKKTMIGGTDTITCADKLIEASEKHGTKKTMIGIAVVCGIFGLGYYYRKDIAYLFTKKRIKADEESKIRIINALGEDRRKTASHKSKLKMEEMDHKEQCRAARSEASMDSGCQECEQQYEPLKSIEEICAEMPVDIKYLQLGFPFLERGSTLGICGPTNVGKTTFASQLAISLALGECEVPIDPDWNPIKPQKVIYLYTEQSNNNLRNKFENVNTNGNLLCQTEGFTVETIVQHVKTQLDQVGSEGLVIFIDNYTSLTNKMGKRNIKRLDNELSALQQKYQDTKPITIVKVFHTDETYKEYRPITESNIKGSANIPNLTQNFIFLTRCNRGDNTRILKVLKNKIAKVDSSCSQNKVSILKYANTATQMFEYVDVAIETDVLPHKYNTPQVNSEPKKRGRPQRVDISDSDAVLLWKMVKNGEATWREIEETYQISKEAIKKRAKKAGK